MKTRWWTTNHITQKLDLLEWNKRGWRVAEAWVGSYEGGTRIQTLLWIYCESLGMLLLTHPCSSIKWEGQGRGPLGLLIPATCHLQLQEHQGTATWVSECQSSRTAILPCRGWGTVPGQSAGFVTLLHVTSPLAGDLFLSSMCSITHSFARSSVFTF